VLRKWQKWIEPEKPKDPDKPTLRDSVANLSEELTMVQNQLKDRDARIAELEEELAAAKTALSQIGTVMPMPVPRMQIKPWTPRN
jgi:hypothetical protein